MKLTLTSKELYQYSLVNQKQSSCLMAPCKGEGAEYDGLSPMEMVAGGVAGCIAIDVQAILKKQRIDTDDLIINIEGVRTGGVPSPFTAISLDFIVDKSIDPARLRKNIQLVIDKYCSVSASLNPAIDISFKINGEEG